MSSSACRWLTSSRTSASCSIRTQYYTLSTRPAHSTRTLALKRMARRSQRHLTRLHPSTRLSQPSLPHSEVFLEVQKRKPERFATSSRVPPFVSLSPPLASTFPHHATLLSFPLPRSSESNPRHFLSPPITSSFNPLKPLLASAGAREGRSRVDCDSLRDCKFHRQHV